MIKKLISIVTPCYNEEENVEELAERIQSTMIKTGYDYEHIFIDNASTDATVSIIKKLILSNKKIKLIVNARNFGHLKSPYYALLESVGEATILIASDLQDPPEIIRDLISKWENGFKTVLIVKDQSEEMRLMFLVRKIYYRIMDSISEIPVISGAHGSGLFDKVVISELRKINDSYPYLRGILCELGYPIGLVHFNQPRRLRGITKNNFYSLFDTAMLGITNHSKVPLRIMTIGGFLLSIVFVLIAIIFLALKIIYWDKFSLGTAPLIIGLFFFGAIQLFFMGLLGEYVGSIHTQIRKMPLVIEKERINF